MLFSCVFLDLPVVIQSIQIRCSQKQRIKVTNLLIWSPVSDVSQSVGSLCKFGCLVSFIQGLVWGLDISNVSDDGSWSSCSHHVTPSLLSKNYFSPIAPSQTFVLGVIDMSSHLQKFVSHNGHVCHAQLRWFLYIKKWGHVWSCVWCWILLGLLLIVLGGKYEDFFFQPLVMGKM